MAYTVYLPAPGSALAGVVEAASALVGNGSRTYRGEIVVGIEPPRVTHLAQNFADRAEAASLRLRDGLRRTPVPADELVPVARFTGDRVVFEYAEDAAALQAWLGSDALGEDELRTTRAVVQGLRREFDRVRADTPRP